MTLTATAMTTMDPKSLKVTELKEELTARGLSTKGLKKELLDRLEEAIATEGGAANGAAVEENNQEEDSKEAYKLGKKQDGSTPEPTVAVPDGDVVVTVPAGEDGKLEVEIDVAKNGEEVTIADVIVETDAPEPVKVKVDELKVKTADESQDIEVEMEIEAEEDTDSKVKAHVKPEGARPVEAAAQGDAVVDETRGDKRKRDDDEMEVDADLPPLTDTKRRRGSESRPSGLDHTIHPPTSSLYITNLRRPLLQPQLIEYLTSFAPLATGKVPSLPDGVWIDGVKSHCYAVFSSVDDASRAAREVHGKKWPEDMGQNLHVEFVETDQLERLVTQEKVAWVNGRAKLALKIEEGDQGFKFELVPAGTPLNMVGRGGPPRIPPITGGVPGRTGPVPVVTGVNAIRPTGPVRAPPPHLNGRSQLALKHTRARPSLSYAEGPRAVPGARAAGGRAPLPPQAGPPSNGWGRRGGGGGGGGGFGSREGRGGFQRRERWDTR